MSKRVELNIRVPNQTRYLAMVGQLGESLAFSLHNFHGNRRELAYHLNLVLTEALTNAIRHGNQGDPDKYVNVTISASEEDLVIRVFDQGKGFDLTARQDMNPLPCDEGGRGVNIIMKLMDDVHCTRKKGVNILEMRKILK
jgi:serine/threonine-protein kinase RsbW